MWSSQQDVFCTCRLLRESASCLLISMWSLSQQGGDDAASLSNSHGGLPSAGSTSSTELNHQVEAFRGQSLLCRWHGSVEGLFRVLPPSLLHWWQVSLQACLARFPPPWSWRLRSRKRTICTITSLIDRTMRATEETWRHPEQAHAPGRFLGQDRLSIRFSFQKWNLFWKVSTSAVIFCFAAASPKMRIWIQSRRPSVSARGGWPTTRVNAWGFETSTRPSRSWAACASCTWRARSLRPNSSSCTRLWPSFSAWSSKSEVSAATWLQQTELPELPHIKTVFRFEWF